MANALLARDYKGFGNQGMNGVIERKNDIDVIDRLIPYSGKTSKSGNL